MTRPRLVLGNWKMNPPTIAEAVALARAVATAAPTGRCRCRSRAAGRRAGRRRRGRARYARLVYAQDVHWEDKGAYTGQTSASMLVGVAAGTIVGHSEVRRDLGDDDTRVARKLARAIAAGLRVVLCVRASFNRFCSVTSPLRGQGVLLESALPSACVPTEQSTRRSSPAAAVEGWLQRLNKSTICGGNSEGRAEGLTTGCESPVAEEGDVLVPAGGRPVRVERRAAVVIKSNHSPTAYKVNLKARGNAKGQADGQDANVS